MFLFQRLYAYLLNTLDSTGYAIPTDRVLVSDYHLFYYLIIFLYSPTSTVGKILALSSILAEDGAIKHTGNEYCDNEDHMDMRLSIKAFDITFIITIWEELLSVFTKNDNTNAYSIFSNDLLLNVIEMMQLLVSFIDIPHSDSSQIPFCNPIHTVYSLRLIQVLLTNKLYIRIRSVVIHSPAVFSRLLLCLSYPRDSANQCDSAIFTNIIAFEAYHSIKVYLMYPWKNRHIATIIFRNKNALIMTLSALVKPDGGSVTHDEASLFREIQSCINAVQSMSYTDL